MKHAIAGSYQAQRVWQNVVGCDCTLGRKKNYIYITESSLHRKSNGEQPIRAARMILHHLACLTV